MSDELKPGPCSRCGREIEMGWYADDDGFPFICCFDCKETPSVDGTDDANVLAAWEALNGRPTPKERELEAEIDSMLHIRADIEWLGDIVDALLQDPPDYETAVAMAEKYNKEANDE